MKKNEIIESRESQNEQPERCERTKYGRRCTKPRDHEKNGDQAHDYTEPSPEEKAEIRKADIRKSEAEIREKTAEMNRLQSEIAEERKNIGLRPGEQEVALCISCLQPLRTAVIPGTPGRKQVCLNMECYRRGLVTLISVTRSEVEKALASQQQPAENVKTRPGDHPGPYRSDPRPAENPEA